MLKFATNTPLRMCLSASGREVLVALAAGGICLVRLSQASAQPYPVLTLDQGSFPSPCRSVRRFLQRYYPLVGRVLKVAPAKQMAFKTLAFFPGWPRHPSLHLSLLPRLRPYFPPQLAYLPLSLPTSLRRLLSLSSVSLALSV